MFARIPPVLLFLFVFLMPGLASASGGPGDAPAYPATEHTVAQYASFPIPLAKYGDAGQPLMERIKGRITADPFNLAASIIFACAILHTFLAGAFNRLAHHFEHKHQHKIEKENRTASAKPHVDARDDVSFRATLCHYLGEVEAIFATWAIPLAIAAIYYHGWPDLEKFVGIDCDFREPMFVVIIMAISASRPVVRFAEACLSIAAQRLGGGSAASWWISVLTIAPLLGSVITEPAAMTIGALILARKFYELKPGKTFAYATLGLLFVNISVGGVMTNFAAPPVLMVANKWGWTSSYMFMHFGWRSVLAILISNALYFWMFRKQFSKLADPRTTEPDLTQPVYWKDREDPIPVWVTVAHLAFLGWTVFTNHYPALYIGGFLFFLAFTHATDHHQNEMRLRGPLLVGFFLAGLVIHGRCQAWWLEPIMSSGLSELHLLLGAAGLTAFNDNALITFLASQVPDLDENLKYAVMAGAVAGGGLTVIANAPNPAGQGLLKQYFGDGISPLYLFLGALLPTAIVIGCYTLTHW